MLLKKPARRPIRKVMAKAARYSSGELVDITLAPKATGSWRRQL
jgi:hypothetical protein